MTEIPKEWRLLFRREGGWRGSATKSTMTHSVEILAYNKGYPTFEDCYHVLAGKIELYESEKTK
jgi:hypothetical protein